MDENDRSDYLFSDGTSGDVRGRLKEQWAGATRVRVGYAMDRWLPYIAAGDAYAKVYTSYRLRDAERNTVSGYSVNDRDTFTGWTIGADVDYAMTDHVILHAEYRYSDFGDKD
ncbi:outer membrane autotransporter barrel domain-containing protein [Bartonella tamiae Th307]|uniref:Outer membrane autotransporter barrel domain-containing protein n=1 Tax=Bartonella tamiae Th239 TaxID=1094558 RepID=J0QXJ8_9HYPH|nr:outer membrane autotransporter barrel domain-containing protein [Bartonella tamiae Th239]EJF93429.1 outer membrane autotransporter barrel domain-containing protein [Bartonella tamiae Th307]